MDLLGARASAVEARMTSTARPSTTRSWLSPVTAVSFVVIAVTGVLLFVHLRLPGMTFLHEIAGLLFVVAGVVHLVLNWRSLLGYFRHRSARIALGVSLVATGLTLVAGFAHDEHEGQRRHGPPTQQSAER